jgi:hypothetical protein
LTTEIQQFALRNGANNLILKLKWRKTLSEQYNRNNLPYDIGWKVCEGYTSIQKFKQQLIRLSWLLKSTLEKTLNYE